MIPIETLKKDRQNRQSELEALKRLKNKLKTYAAEEEKSMIDYMETNVEINTRKIDMSGVERSIDFIIEDGIRNANEFRKMAGEVEKEERRIADEIKDLERQEKAQDWENFRHFTS